VTSERKIQANRANARASTGPKTKFGRARAARNSLRHGLSRPIGRDPAWSDQVEALAQEVVGLNDDADVLEFARSFAEAEIDLRRVYSARHHLLADRFSDPYYESAKDTRKKVSLLCWLLRPNARDLPLELVEELVLPRLDQPQKFAVLLSKELKTLAAMNRYEQRARSRRQSALHVLEQALLSSGRK
jgi:sigma54-dependent transcription regulator